MDSIRIRPFPVWYLSRQEVNGWNYFSCPATTENPLPCSPARAASIEAFNANILVLFATAIMLFVQFLISLIAVKSASISVSRKKIEGISDFVVLSKSHYDKVLKSIEDIEESDGKKAAILEEIFYSMQVFQKCSISFKIPKYFFFYFSLFFDKFLRKKQIVFFMTKKLTVLIK